MSPEHPRSDPASPNEWRAVIAALANDAARTTYARIVLGDNVDDALKALSPSRRRHTIDTLRRAGLIEETADGWRARSDVFARILAVSAAAPRPRGPERYLRADGRIDQYPANVHEREALLAVIAQRAFPDADDDDISWTEAEVNDRLEQYADDVALLRRRLVDHGLLARTPSGSTYRRAGGRSGAP